MRFYADFQPVGQNSPTVYRGYIAVDGSILWDLDENEVPQYVRSKITDQTKSWNAYGYPEDRDERIPLAICIGVTLQD